MDANYAKMAGPAAPRRGRRLLLAALGAVAVVAATAAVVLSRGGSSPAAAGPATARRAVVGGVPCPAPNDTAPLPPGMKDSQKLPHDMQCRIKSMMDESVDPCDDFYRYACGGWLNRTDLDGQQEIVVSFSEIGAKVQEEVSAVLKEKYPLVEQFSESCNRPADLRLDALLPFLEQVKDVTDTASFLKVSGALQAQGVAYGALFDWVVQQDLVTARQNLMMLGQNGLSFEGAYYASFPASEMGDLQPAFDALQKAGVVRDAIDAFNKHVAMEEELFKLRPTVELNDPSKWGEEIHCLSPAELKEQGDVDVSAFLAALSPDHAVDTVCVADLGAWKSLAAYLDTVDAETLRNYLVWRAVYGALRFLPEQPFGKVADNLANWAGSDNPYPFPTWALEVTEPEQAAGESGRLPPAMRRPHMRHHRGRGMSPDRLRDMGARFHERMRAAEGGSRAEYCQGLAGGFFGTWYMHQYLLQDFPQVDMNLANRLVNETIAHLRERLTTIAWLDEPTRAKALEKLEHLVPNVATDPFEGTAGLDLDFGKAPFEVFREAVAWRFNHTLYQAGTPYDRHSYQGSPFQMAPWVQNAYYQPTSNTINMLPGLMLPPMFSPDLPYSLNVAAYIMVIGHECTHGYDNTGRLFGPYGAYVNWWTDKAVAEFDKRTQCLVNQYSDFEAFGVHVNGSQTLGENIADGGGVDMAWSVYKSIEPAPVENMLDGVTNDQLHFLYYAQTWCTKLTKEAFEQQVAGDVHSPDQFRIRGPLSNFKPFAEAYGCKADQYYGRSLTNQACEVW